MLHIKILTISLALARVVAAGALPQEPHHSTAQLSSIQKRAAEGYPCGEGVGSCDDHLCCGPNGLCGTGGGYCSAPECQLSYGPACHGNTNPAGADTSTVPRPKFGKVPYGADIRSCYDPGTIAITFDDGPFSYTNDLLEILKGNGVVATFFVSGVNGAKGAINDLSTEHPAVLRRMLADGHQVASHSWSHQHMDSLTPEQWWDQVIKLEIAFADLFGFFPTYWRPPYTECNDLCYANLNDLGYHVTNYNLDTKDWQGDFGQARNNFADAFKWHDSASGGLISLAHDIHSETVYSLTQYMIDTARANGYKIVTVGQCLGDPEENWYRDAKTGEPVGRSHVSAIAQSKGTTAAEKKGKDTAGKGTGGKVGIAAKPLADDSLSRKDGPGQSMTLKPSVKQGAGHTLEAPAAGGCLLGLAVTFGVALFVL